MHKLFLNVFLAIALSIGVQAQTPSAASATLPDIGIKANLALGEVSAISAAANKIVLQTKDGAIDVGLMPTTTFKRVSPENPSLAAATAANLADIGVGDKILVTGTVSADKKTVPAKQIFLMTKADIVKKNEKERAAWKTRGIAGKIVALSPQTKQVTISVSGLGAERNVILTPKSTVVFRRYAPDSISFSDAKLSSFAELKVGDRVRALGDKSADEAGFQAEEIVSGSFTMVGGTITAIDAQKKEITIKDLQTNKPITIVVRDTSVLKKFPTEMASMMAMRMGGGMQPPQGRVAAGGNAAVRPPRSNQTGGQASPDGMGEGGGMRGARGEFDDLLERFPNVSLAELKIGDAIAVSSTTGVVPDRVTAIKLLTGVEPFFQAQQAGRRNSRGDQSPTLNIPGLDGIGTP